MGQPALPVLFTHYGDAWLRGSEQLLLDLLGNLDRNRVEPILWCNAEPMEQAARALGIVTYRTGFEFYLDYGSKRFSPARYAAFVREGVALVRRHRVRVIHANSAAPNQFLAPVARITRRPLLAHLHIDYLRRSRYACLLHQATLLVGVSRQVIEDFLRDGMAEQRTQVIYNGIDFARLRSSAGRDPRKELGIPPEAVVVAAVGSLIRRKGQDVLIRAFAAGPAGRAAHLLIVSDGPERANYEALAAELGLNACVHFLGYYDDVPAVYRAADMVALASRGDAFGLVLAEAGYFSLAAVSTSVGGIPEVVEHGVTGLLVPPDDPPALARALCDLIDDASLRRKLGEAARARAIGLFSVARMAAEFQTAYEQLSQLPEARLGWFGSFRSIRPYAQLVRAAARSQRPAKAN